MKETIKSPIPAILSLLVVVVLIAGIGWLRSRGSESPLTNSEHAAIAGEDTSPFEQMVTDSEGGALEQDLAKPLDIDVTPIQSDLSEIEAERGFLSFEDIVSADEDDGDPHNARERFTNEELLGGYQRRFVGDGTVAEVQINVMRFATTDGADAELQFGISDMTNHGLDVDPSPLPATPSVLARAPAVAASRDLEATVLSWSQGQNLFTVVVLAESGDYGEAVARQLVEAIGV